MSLRSPIYLDTETLLSQAEYHDIEIPRQEQIVEKTTRKRAGGGKAAIHGFGLDASRATDIEYQSTYTLAPRQTAMVSKVIDALLHEGAVKTGIGPDTPIVRDDLVEIEGRARITAASMAGKVFFIFRRLMETLDLDFEQLVDLSMEDLPVGQEIKKVYLGNELLPIPMLLEVVDSGMPQRVYVNLEPDHFTSPSAVSRVETEIRVLGRVDQLIDAGGDGFLSAERWLLHDWEHFLRRKLMTDIGGAIKGLLGDLDLDLPAEDVHDYLTGPAIVVEAISLY